MAWQPISGEGLDWSRDAFAGLGEALSQLAQRRQQRQLADREFEYRQSIAAQQERERHRAAFGDAYMKASQLAQEGDLAGAQMLLSPFGRTSIVDTPAPQGPPTSLPDAQRAAAGGGGFTGQGGSSVPDSLDGGRAAPAVDPATNARRAAMVRYGGKIPPEVEAQLAQMPAAQPSSFVTSKPTDMDSNVWRALVVRHQGRITPEALAKARTPVADATAAQYPSEVAGEGGAMAAAQREGDEDAEAFGDEMDKLIMAGLPRAPLMFKENPNRVEAARQNELQKQALRAARRIRFESPLYGSVEIDPDARRRFIEERQALAMQRNAEVLDAAFGESDDAEIRRYYPQVRAAFAATAEPVNPRTVLAHIRSMAQEDSRAEREETRLDRADARLDRELDTRVEIAQMRRRPRGGGGTGAGGRPIKLTDAQGKAAAGLRVIVPELHRLQSLRMSPDDAKLAYEEIAADAAAAKSPTVDYLARLAGARKNLTAKMSPEGRRAFEAFRSFGDLVVRQRSGTAATPAEVANVLGPIMQAYGDSSIDEADKKQRLRDVAYSFVEQVGPERDRWKGEIDAVFDGSERVPSAGGPSRAATGGPSAEKRNQDLARVNRELQRSDLDPAKRRALETLKARIGSGR